MIRDHYGNTVQKDDVLCGVVFPGRQIRVVDITHGFVTYTALNWTPIDLSLTPEKRDGLVHVRRKVWDRMACWELAEFCEPPKEVAA
jgi:hypothetical protein